MRTLIALAFLAPLTRSAAAEPTRAAPPPSDTDFGARVIAAGSLAPAPAGVVELGLLADAWFYVHVDAVAAYDVSATKNEYPLIPGGGGGVDLIWGAKTLGYAGPCFVYLHNLDRGDFHADASMRFAGMRLGFESPVSRHVAIRGWLTLGVADVKDSTSGDGHYETLPYGSLNLGVALRL